MLELNRERLAWCAGFFDGEGSVGCYPNKDKAGYRIRVSIQQKNDDEDFSESLERFNIYTRYLMNPGQATISMGRLETAKFENAQALMCLLWPWLGFVKRNQFKKATQQFVSWSRETRKYINKHEHGTHGMYERGCRCILCVSFHRDYHREYMRQRRAQ